MKAGENEGSEEDRRNARLPGAQAEFNAFYDSINPLINETQSPDESGETVRITLDVPREWIAFAAWLELKTRMRMKGNLGKAPPVSTAGHATEKRLARAYIARELNNQFHMELHDLATGGHPYLYPPKPAPAGPAWSIDDEIPF